MKIPVVVSIVLLIGGFFVAGIFVAGSPSAAEAQNPVSAPPATSAVRLEHCMVSLMDEAQVPAEEAGVLLTLHAELGQQVKEGDLLAQIDDTRAKLQKDVAISGLKVAQKKAANTTSIDYSVSASRVAKSEYIKAQKANEKRKGTYPEAEMERLWLTYEKTLYEIKQAEMNKSIAEEETQVSKAEVDAADEAMKRRQIKSPLDGIVVKRYQHKGEWVLAGDPVMHVVGLKRLKVEAYVKATNWDPSQLDGRPVTVTVEFARDHSETFTGNVTFVNPLVPAGGEYGVTAVVENRPDASGRRWLLRPGLIAEMDIQLQ